MNKKFLIIGLIIIGVVLISGWFLLNDCQRCRLSHFWDIGGCDIICLGLPFVPEENQITIATDKTEYEQGEIVKIIINNNLNENVYYYENIYCCLEYKKENEVWIVSRAINIPCLKGEMKEIESKGVVYFSIDFTEGGFTHYFGGGKYRIAFNYKIDKNITTSDIIYSNEFTIK